MTATAKYDGTVDAFSVDFGDGGEVAATVRFDQANLVDVDANGVAVAIEVLDPSQARISEMAEKFGFADRLDEIREAVGGVVPSLIVETFTATSFQAFIAESQGPLTSSHWIVPVGDSHGEGLTKRIDLARS